MFITTEDLLHYQRCKRRVFLDHYGDRSKKDGKSDFFYKLAEERQIRQKTILNDYDCHTPIYQSRDWNKGAVATELLMQQGVDYIAKGVLLIDYSSKIKLLSFPDLLVKYPGQSKWGDWFYSPIQIELGKKPKQEYKITATFHGYLLKEIQGFCPETAIIKLRRPNPHTVNLFSLIGHLETLIGEYIELLSQKKEPDVFISKSRCMLCSWLKDCKEVAHSLDHLSLLPGITPNRYDLIKSLGLTTIRDLATTNLTDLMTVLDEDIANKLLLQAKALVENKVILKQKPVPIKLAPVEFYFDIEAEPYLDVHYLLGVFMVDNRKGTQEYYPLLAETVEDEGKIWVEFLKLINNYPWAPIYHFCDYESQTIELLGTKYQTPMTKINSILNRLVDLHKYTTDTVYLPVPSYSLKHLGNWLGYHWVDKDADGSQSICWYDEWLGTGDRIFIEQILSYNRDDCIATYVLKQWLSSL